MEQNSLPDLCHPFEKRKGFEKFLEILKIYEHHVADPAANISLLFGLENHVRRYCKEYSLDFEKVIAAVMEGKALNYTRYVENWTKDEPQ
jgi:hypothetical protein